MKNKITPQAGIEGMIEAGLTELIVEGTPFDEVLKVSEERAEYLKDKVNAPSNNPLMLLSMEKDHMPVHYVYEHRDEDGEVVYVGMGIDGRAYEITLRRKHCHARWLLEQQLKGREFAKILVAGHCRNNAEKVEAMLIKKYQPRFNTVGK